MASQSKMLTGTLTGTKRWNGCGDASFEDRRSGKPLSGTFGAEAERLARVRRKAGLSCSDKNEATLTGNDQPIECYAAHVARREPRCRERNRRWRKSHHNKNLTAPRLVRKQTGENLIGC
jgi:hypothetical protein